MSISLAYILKLYIVNIHKTFPQNSQTKRSTMTRLLIIACILTCGFNATTHAQPSLQVIPHVSAKSGFSDIQSANGPFGLDGFGYGLETQLHAGIFRGRVGVELFSLSQEDGVNRNPPLSYDGTYRTAFAGIAFGTVPNVDAFHISGGVNYRLIWATVTNPIDDFTITSAGFEPNVTLAYDADPVWLYLRASVLFLPSGALSGFDLGAQGDRVYGITLGVGVTLISEWNQLLTRGLFPRLKPHCLLWGFSFAKFLTNEILICILIVIYLYTSVWQEQNVYSNVNTRMISWEG